MFATWISFRGFDFSRCRGLCLPSTRSIPLPSPLFYQDPADPVWLLLPPSPSLILFVGILHSPFRCSIHPSGLRAWRGLCCVPWSPIESWLALIPSNSAVWRFCSALSAICRFDTGGFFLFWPDFSCLFPSSILTAGKDEKEKCHSTGRSMRFFSWFPFNWQGISWW